VRRARWVDLAAAAAAVPDGASVAPGGFMLGRAPMALVFELVRQGRRGLHVVSLPNPLPAEILVAAGAARKVEFLFAAISLDCKVRPMPCLKRAFPGVAGAATLRRWIAKPVIVLGRQSRRNLVARVQVSSTSDPGRRTRLLTDLGVFELGGEGAALVARHPWAAEEAIAERTGFAFATASPLPVTPPPSAEHVRAIRRIDGGGLRDRLIG
jgi:hypothetical protein